MSTRHVYQTANGFSLIEVLVTLVVLSIGLLSLAALQLATLKYNSSALTRFEATVLAYDILDRMRANHASALQGQYNINLGENATTGTDLSSRDVYAWKRALAHELPNGDGAVVVNGRLASVSVQWSEDWDETLGTDPNTHVMSVMFRTEL